MPIVSVITVVTEKCHGLLFSSFSFALSQPKSRKMKWSSERTSDKVYGVKTLRPSYPGKAQSKRQGCTTVNEKHMGILHQKFTQSKKIDSRFDGLHYHQR